MANIGNKKLTKMDMIRINKMRREAKKYSINENNAEHVCKKVCGLVNDTLGEKVESIERIDEGNYKITMTDGAVRETYIKSKKLLELVSGVVKEVNAYEKELKKAQKEADTEDLENTEEIIEENIEEKEEKTEEVNG